MSLRGVALAAALAASASLASSTALAAPIAPRAAAPLALGVFDGAYSGPLGETWLQRTVDAGAGFVRIDVGWVAPDTATRPAGFDPRDPADPAYAFATADAAIRAADARGLRVLASFTGAPAWAEGRNRPADAPPGSWRPDPAALRDYGVALAQRYSGGFPDPERPGLTLPEVAAFQAWNEPNLSKYLTPQWSGRAPAAPAHYRRMLNAFSDGVRSTGSDALVVTAGTAPFGDPLPGGERIMPARFVRSLLCLRSVRGRLSGTPCAEPARFDVLSHHPYSVGAPTRRALNRDDVSIPDLGKLTRLLRAAERTGRAPGGRHAMWVTEVSYDSGPPDPDGVPIARHARFVQRSLYELWRQGVQAVFWYQIGDQAPEPSFGATNQSGLYLRDGTAKPALQAFRFPLVALRAGTREVRVWGRAPQAGTVAIERRTAAGWRPVQSLTLNMGETFVSQIVHRGEVTLRARVNDEASLGSRVR